MFHHSAAYYDAIYRELKDYAEEAMRLDYLLSRLDPKPKRLLDVGCGTGEHARLLIEHFGYQVDGADIEPEFVEIAAKKASGGRFTVADMRDFDLGRRYDAVLCLFSSIGYVETEQGLHQAFACMARHLERGGSLVCEPWSSPEIWQPGRIDAIEVTDEATGDIITRTRAGETEGKVSVLKIEYDVRRNGQELHFQEEHRLGLFTREQMTKALESAGFSVRWAEEGLHAGPIILANYLP